MITGQIALGAVIIGDIVLLALRFRNPPAKSESIFLLGLVLIIAAVVLGFFSLATTIGLIELILAVIELLLILRRG